MSEMIFIETYSNYPTLNSNQILISLIKQYEFNKIIYITNQFSNYKANLKKINLFDKSIYEKLNDIKLKGKNLLSCFIKYKDIQTQNYKNFRIYSTDLSISLLNSKEMNQYFIDTTFRCEPNEIHDSNSLLVMLGYNNSKDIFELILVALITNEDNELLSNFYSYLINTYHWSPKYITIDFALGNIKAINQIFSNSNTRIITCLFNLMQSWWRKAGNLGLRRKNIYVIQKPFYLI